MKDRNLNHSDNWRTPVEVYTKLNKEFGFDFDPCPLNNNIAEYDGLIAEWGGVNFVNPPYSQQLKEAFVVKSIAEAKKGKVVVMLLPVSTSTKLFHRYILPNAKEIRFWEGRIKFEGFGRDGRASTGAGMHDSMIVIFDGTD